MWRESLEVLHYIYMSNWSTSLAYRMPNWSIKNTIIIWVSEVLLCCIQNAYLWWKTWEVLRPKRCTSSFHCLALARRQNQNQPLVSFLQVIKLLCDPGSLHWLFGDQAISKSIFPHLPNALGINRYHGIWTAGRYPDCQGTCISENCWKIWQRVSFIVST